MSAPNGQAAVAFPQTAAAWVARFSELRPPTATAGAAVTIVLRDGATEVEALLIERAKNPNDPASGDAALPGGRVDEEDGSLMSTALRELREEVGLGPADLAGGLRYVVTTPAPRFGMHVGVFTAELSGSASPPSIGSPGEVAHVFWLPRAALLGTRQVTVATARDGNPVPAAVHAGHVVWGFTRRVLREFFEIPVDAAEAHR